MKLRHFDFPNSCTTMLNSLQFSIIFYLNYFNKTKFVFIFCNIDSFDQLAICITFY